MLTKGYVTMSDLEDTKPYKMLGNGWTVEVIKHIMKGMM